MKRYDWGTTRNGEAATLYELETDSLLVRILNRGATIVDFIVKPLQRNIVLGYDSIHGYEQGDAYLGATVGRVANRIANARCKVAETEYQWTPNNGPNLLHSGAHSLSFAMWQLVPNSERQEANYEKLVLATTLQEQQDGFPGDLRVQLIVELVGAELRLTYQYMTSKDSVVNITGHSYFNLNGTASLPHVDGVMATADQGLITNHEIQLNAKYYMPFGEHQIPTGEIAPVEDTPFDFREWKLVGKALTAHYQELAEYRGYDHQYILANDGIHSEPRAIADIQRCGAFRVSDLELTVLSDAPGFQFYTGNWLADEGRNSEVYEQYSGLCIEPQFAPNDVNMPAFQESLTKANEMYERRIVYAINLGYNK